MTTYYFASLSFSDPNNFNEVDNYRVGQLNGAKADALPTAGDTVFFTDNGFGTLNVDSVDELWLTSGSVTANSATGTFTTAGNSGAAASIVINGTISGHVRSRQGGEITAENATGTIQSLGGTITITNDLTLNAHGTNSIDLAVSSGGTVKVQGDLDLRNGNTNGRVQVSTGLVEVEDEIKLGVFTNNGLINVFVPGGESGVAKLKAKSITIGSETASMDDCGNWQRTGNNGQLNIAGNGYVAVTERLTLASPMTKFDDGVSINLLSSGASMQIGGDNGRFANRLTISSAGILEGHGRFDAISIVNDGNVYVEHGIMRFVADTISGSGTVHIREGAHFISSAATNATGANSNKIVFEARASESLRTESVLELQRPHLFSGEISGVAVGDTIQMNGGLLVSPLNFQKPGISHAYADPSGFLRIAVRDGVTTPGPSGNIDFSVAGLPADHDFAVRLLAGSELAFSLVKNSPKIIKGPTVDGSPTNGADPYVDALIWGWSKWNVTKGPITYVFADADDVGQAVTLHGDTRLLTCENPSIAQPFVEEQKTAFRAATGLYSSVSNLTFQEVTSVATANIVVWVRSSHPDDKYNPDGTAKELVSGDTEFLPYRPDGRLWMFLNNAAGMANPTSLAAGGEAYADIVHELGHALGLAHPHDGGGELDANAFPGATDGSPGPNGENQRIFSVMSYNRGWDGERTTSFMFGHNVGLGAFDIAAIQNLYGSKTHNESGNTYLLPSHNVKGTGWQSIWDTGGIDEISNVGSGDDATIDLRTAPLTVGANAGGYVSWVRSIQGGFTIANGVVIERALGGSGDDTLIGNSARNVLDGGRGDDVMTGGAEVDTFVVDGRDTDHITDFGFNGTADVIRITGVYTSFSQVESHISKVSGDTSIDFGGGNFVILNGFTGALTASHFEFSSAPSGPEISVTGNGITIVDGASTPSGADGSAFGAQPLGALVERTFTVTNHGDATLTTSGLKLPKGFKLASGESLAATILAGQSDTFKVVVDTAKVGAFGGVIIFNTNDADEGSFDFAVSASVVASTAVPNIELLGAGNIIVDGDTTPSATDDTDFGTVGVSETVIHTFTVNNTGEGILNISKMKLPKGFVLVEGPSALIPEGGSDTFQVRVDTAKTGAFAGSVTFTTNDPDAKAFDFGLKANVIVIPPEIEVTGNGVAILDNDTSPSITDHTDFGAVPVGETLTQTFTVNNTGAGVLSISKLKLPKGFVLEEGLSSTIAAGGSDNFTVRIDTAKVGLKAGTVTFTTNDPDEGAFNFNLIGNVTAPTATVASLGEGYFESQFIFEQANQLVGLHPDSNEQNHAYALGQMHQLDLL